jgi:hypothetical protein
MEDITNNKVGAQHHMYCDGKFAMIYSHLIFALKFTMQVVSLLKSGKTWKSQSYFLPNLGGLTYQLGTLLKKKLSPLSSNKCYKLNSPIFMGDV